MPDIFPATLRNIANRILSNLGTTDVSLQWTDTMMRARIANNVNTWTLVNGKWMRSCTCKAPGVHCIHDYISCMLVQVAFLREGWTDSNGKPTISKQQAAPSQDVPPQQQPQRPAIDDNKPRPVSFPTARESFFTPSSFNQPVLPIATPTGKQTPAITKPVAKIEAEIDLKATPSAITIRFYQKINDMRELLTMQQFFNLAADIRRSEPRYDWSQDDKDFISWCSPKLRAMQNARMLPFQSHFFTLKREAFSQWLDHWVEQPNRFIERESQKPYHQSGMTRPVRISIELVNDHEFINVIFRYVFQDGSKKTLLEIARHIQDAPDKEDIRAALKAFKPPFDMAPFWKGTVRIRREDIATELPKLLEGHLELVTGKNVIVLSDKDRPVIVKFSVQGGYFVIEAELDGKPIDLEGHSPVQSTVKHQYGTTEIRLGKVTGVDAVREAIHQLPPAVFIRDGAAILYETPQNAEHIKKFWDALPSKLQKVASKELVGFLDPPSKPLTLHLDAKPRNTAFTAVNCTWSFGDGTECSTEDLKLCAAAKRPFFKSSDGKWLAIDQEQARQALDKLREIGLANFVDATLLTAHAGEAVKKLTEAFHTEIPPESQEFARRLSEQPPLSLPPLPEHLDNLLRHYQKEGAEFLLDRAACGAGAILADDMGLGKTLQVLAVLEACRDDAKRRGQPFKSLVVCPASVVAVWLSQAQRFCPSLSIAAISGTAAQRKRQFANQKAEVFVTHYQIVRQDVEVIKNQEFDFLILDEAQAIKNPSAQVTIAVNKLTAKHAIALTGTPLENSAQDLWSIMNRLNPGFLGSLEDFQSRYIQKNGGLTALSRKLSPLIIRRNKQLVAPELPPKTEEIITVELTDEQRAFYDAQLAFGQTALKEHGTGSLLGTLTRLREACCHPQLVTKRETTLGSAKLDMLLEKLSDLQASGHSSLVFSQFTSMLDLIAPKLDERQIPYRVITGETPVEKRAQLVQEFDADNNPSVFLLSLKAAGTGLTLTKADYVFLFDPWWNPAVERQAIDRTHRIGQDKPVFAYKFVAKDTVEEKVQTLIERKKELFDEVMDGAAENAAPARLTLDDLRSLIE
ncbi:MAG: DEAD/DEAH box helicase [Victivallales bacterium]|nr:DEAD/DEAH box helicase [Victivallales bacterium]